MRPTLSLHLHATWQVRALFNDALHQIIASVIWHRCVHRHHAACGVCILNVMIADGRFGCAFEIPDIVWHFY